MIYQKKGSGAVIKVKDTFIKASSVSRDFSLKQMEKRLGAFEESAYLIPNLGGLVETTNFLTMVHSTQQPKHFQEQAPSQDQKLPAEQPQELAHAQPYKQLRHSPLSSKSQQASDKQSSSNAQPKIVPLSQCPMMMRGKAPAKLTLRQQRKIKKKKKLPNLLPRFLQACGGVENFLHTDCPEYGGSRLNKEHIKLWFQYQDARFKKKQEKIVHEIQTSLGITTEKKTFGVPKFTEWLKANHPDKLDSWRYERIQNYITNDDTKESCVISFFDKVEGKLGELVQAGWKKISIHGSDFFKQLVMKLSYKHRLKITNPELQESLIKTEEEYNKIDSMKEMHSFLAYHKGIQADKYRITYKNINNTENTCILDRQYHVNGFTPEQLQERIHEMLKIQSEGNTFSIRPLSENKHYILVDNMSRANLEEFLLDGYRPTVILENNSSNYQVIITIPKFGGRYDDAIGDRLATRLNKLYGNEKRDGNIDTCPLLHRIPAFQNHEHKQADGICFTVQLIQSEQIECPRTYRLAQQFNMQYESNRKTSDYTYSKFNELIAKQNNTHYNSYEGENSANTAYLKHLQNIRSHIDVIDKSRVDAMIAVRMRATGHSQANIEQAIKDCAREWREANERKSWDDYARRTAEYAFSYSGYLEMLKNEKHHKKWFSVEGKVQSSNTMQERGRRPRG